MNGREPEFAKKKWKSLVLIIAAALLAELVLFNISAWKSLFYTDREILNVTVEGGTETVPGSHEYMPDEGILTLHIGGLDRRVHNLMFDVEFSENKEIPYIVTLADEGNYYPYSLPEGIVMPSIRRSYYTNLYPAGKVRELTIQFTIPEGGTVRVNGVSADARLPFVFHIGRLIAVAGFMLLIYSAGSTTLREMPCRRTKGQMLITGLVILLLMGMAWRLSRVNPACITPPWPHHKQYQELAEVITKGQLHLDAEPSEGLINAVNPYDTIYLQANQIEYRADYAYYQGSYYVYFGVVPELLLYLPCYILTGQHLPNYMAVFLLFCGFITAVFALFYEIIKRWFARTPFLIYLMVSTLTVLCGNYLFVIARPDMYNVPIMAANLFTAAGLWLWIKGKYEERTGNKRLWLLLGSLCMALVAGCRPQMLLFSFLAVPLFWEEVMYQRVLFAKKGAKETFCICFPYGAIAAGIMYYNYARFGSVFDFGAAYSLTSNDMTNRGFNLHQALLGIWHYFMRPPVITSDFPFLQGVQIASESYMGKLNAEYTYGGMLISNVFLWMLLYLNKGKALLKKKGIYAVVIVSMSVSLVICIADVTGAGILQRYMVDMIWGIWFAAVLVILAVTNIALDGGKYKRMMTVLSAACAFQLLYGVFIIFGNGDLGMNIRIANPELYYRVRELFIW